MPHIHSRLVRVPKRHSEDRNNCLVVALHTLLAPLHPAFSYAAVHRLLAAAGREKNKRFCIKKAVLALREHTLLRLSQLSIPGTWISTRTFARLHPSGRFLIRTGGHAMACINGVFYDTQDVGDRLQVTHGWKVPEPIPEELQQTIVLRMASIAQIARERAEPLQFPAQRQHPGTLVAR